MRQPRGCTPKVRQYTTPNLLLSLVRSQLSGSCIPAMDPARQEENVQLFHMLTLNPSKPQKLAPTRDRHSAFTGTIH